MHRSPKKYSTEEVVQEKPILSWNALSEHYSRISRSRITESSYPNVMKRHVTFFEAIFFFFCTARTLSRLTSLRKRRRKLRKGLSEKKDAIRDPLTKLRSIFQEFRKIRYRRKFTSNVGFSELLGVWEGRMVPRADKCLMFLLTTAYV